MAYTVKQLAKLSGVSVRTLHFYDEIGLLKPAYVGDNNYRYYQDDELLKLQQILFYKKLNFSLEDIQKIVCDKNFDTLKALQSHKSILENSLDKTKNLIQTIEKTINHLRGIKQMKLEEIFEGFDADKQAMYENFLIEQGVDEKKIENVRNKVDTWSKDDWMQNKNEADDLYAQFASAIEHHLSPSSSEVQALTKKHFEMTKKFWTPNKESYIGLSQLYGSHPDFVKFYNKIHPNLLPFLVEAMEVFANRELK
ncbi:MAG: transcriptional regulator [Gammaproteobacteria bacterium RIFCSPHIGHO2_12_FULL_38_14]|nr:MAG: transcriptional regulator [Gammaproteobacteria bacterium RIFCSPHIGHO2_12_FULL_38_14]